MTFLEHPPQLGVLQLTLAPQTECRFQYSPARSLHAALLRRLELMDPALSQALHDEIAGYRSSAHPWAISPLLGGLELEDGSLKASPGRQFGVRVAALSPVVLDFLAASFDRESPMGREPLVLENVPFHVVAEASRWEDLNSYASLLTAARPLRRIALRFLSPTAFRSQGQTSQVLTPLRCVQSYLTRWNAFADVELPEEALLEYAGLHVIMAEERLSPKAVRLGPRRAVTGVVGQIVWEADDEMPAMLRLVNALADYASYCGTGVSTAQGMGQTRRERGFR